MKKIPDEKYYEKISVSGGFKDFNPETMVYCKECDLFIYKKYVGKHIHRKEQYDEYKKYEMQKM